ncbi:MAG: serine/threonine-protein kinase [Gemmatimonadetes bacterium]|nr:serine/threonine-protein kinase [Gemmatimonadota bacterium]
MDRTTLLPQDAVNPPTSRPPDSDEGRASSQGSNPPAALVASLADHYVIERELGQGGMATVYLAHDVKHDRSVALKVLRPELAAVLGADRFVQEIKTTANLSHPNILPLFDSGTADGFLYYVMPFVDGETLRDKLNRETQFAVDEAVHITAEIAEALDYAHRHEVIHRDIKPENILLHDGRPMVADFGIALAVSAAAGGRMTETGLSLGTPHYMSPEQATAEKDITARSDVYSLGCMLYEMLTGDPPHVGASAYQIIMKIVTEEPAPVTNLRKSVPPYVAATVAKALSKLPADRFATAHDFAEALLGRAAVIAPNGTAAPMGTTAHRGVPTASGTSRRSRLKDPVVLGLGVVAVASVAFAALSRGRGEAATVVPPIRYVIATTDSARPVDNYPWPAATSPDGAIVVYSVGGRGAGSQLYALHTDQLQAHPIPGTDEGYQPYFSPDGRWLAFEVSGKEKKVRLDGSAPVTITDAGSANGACWTPTNEIVLGAQGAFRGLSHVSAAGGQAKALTEPDTAAGVGYHVWPIAAPDGKTVVFTLWYGSLATSKLAVTDLDDGKVVPLGVPGIRPLAVLDGALVYVQADGQVMAVPFDAGAKKVSGSPIPVGDPVAVPSSTNGNSGIFISAGGALVESRGVSRARLAWVSPDGRRDILTPEALPMVDPRISPDGGRIAVNVADGQNSDAWIYDRSLKTFSRLTTLGTVQYVDWINRDEILFTGIAPDGSGGVWTQAASGGTPPKRLLTYGTQIPMASMSPDGKWLAITTLGSSSWDVLKVSLDSSGKSEDFLATRANERGAVLSPDGKWVALISDESGQDEVYLRSFPDPSSRIPISGPGGYEPVWSRDGTRLFYRANGLIMEARFQLTPTLSLVSRDTLKSASDFGGTYYMGASYDVSRDMGMVGLMSDANDYQLVVSPNWITELRRKVAENNVSR